MVVSVPHNLQQKIPQLNGVSVAQPGGGVGDNKKKRTQKEENKQRTQKE